MAGTDELLIVDACCGLCAFNACSQTYVDYLRRVNDVRHFTRQFARRMNKVIESIPSETTSALYEYGWPGNIRELQNASSAPKFWPNVKHRLLGFEITIMLTCSNERSPVYAFAIEA